jgi:hypothetical protein
MNSNDFNWKRRTRKWDGKPLDDSYPCCLWCGNYLHKLLHTVEVRDGDPEPQGEIVERKKWYWKSAYTTVKYHTGERGAFGNGFFCSKACGYRFAVAAAQEGFRLTPKPDNDTNTAP